MCDLGLLLDHHRAVEVVFCVWLPRLEDGDVDLTVLAEHLELEIGLDVFGGDAVFVDESAGDTLPKTFSLSVSLTDLPVM